MLDDGCRHTISERGIQNLSWISKGGPIQTCQVFHLWKQATSSKSVRRKIPHQKSHEQLYDWQLSHNLYNLSKKRNKYLMLLKIISLASVVSFITVKSELIVQLKLRSKLLVSICDLPFSFLRTHDCSHIEYN